MNVTSVMRGITQIVLQNHMQFLVIFYQIYVQTAYCTLLILTRQILHFAHLSETIVILQQANNNLSEMLHSQKS